MKLVIFGLTITSSWGNGHATLWRGLCRALARAGHDIVFFERDVPYYAITRDLAEMTGVDIVLYDDWETGRARARRELADADVGLVTSYCADGVAAAELVTSEARPLKVFYDLDTPITLAALASATPPSYIGADRLRGFDLVLSYTGGAALDGLQRELGARRVAPLYGHVDPEQHHATEPVDDFRCDLSYLGTYAHDRQSTLDELFLRPASRLATRRFILAGAQYPSTFPWRDNIWHRPHVTPREHPAFFSSSRMTLNVTRRAMAELGHCPSGRLFEAAACGVPMVSDSWDGLDAFFTPGEEIIVCETAADVIAALERTDAELQRIASAAYGRVMSEHTAAHRAAKLIRLLEDTSEGRAHVGNHSGGGQRQSDPTAGVLEGAAARR